MRIQQFEAKVLEMVGHVLGGQRIEDHLVEAKAQLPDSFKVARQLGGHANSAHGEDIFWIVGLDEDEHRIVKVDQDDFAKWWQEVSKCFDEGITPLLEPLWVPIGKAQRVLALKFETSRAPYVIKRPHGQKGFEREVPWREGTRTRSAYRHDLIKMLVSSVSIPEVEMVEASLQASLEPASFHTDQAKTAAEPTRVHIWCSGKLFLTPLADVSVVFPNHRVSMEVEFVSSKDGTVKATLKPTIGQLTSAFSGSLEQEALSAVQSGDGAVYVNGAGKTTFRGSGSLPEENWQTISKAKRCVLRLRLPIAGSEKRAFVEVSLGNSSGVAVVHQFPRIRWTLFPE